MNKAAHRQSKIRYPRTYRASTGWKLFISILTIPMGAGSLWGLIWAIVTTQEKLSGKLLVGGISLAFLTLSAYTAACFLFTTIVLDAERLTDVAPENRTRV